MPKGFQKSVLFLFVMCLGLAGLASASQELTSPDSFLGHALGEDKKLADYQQILDYFRLLDTQSDQLQTITIGRSTQNREMILAVITSTENMAKLDQYKSLVRRLRDARDLDDQSARELAREGKNIVLITCGLHATEIASTQMAMEFAYQLLSGKGDYDLAKALNDVIVLLSPSTNPDGHQMVCDWYNKQLGTPFEGMSPPWLYHPYAGHDNNRDWFMFNLSETQAINQVLYHDWIPQIHIDEHQMGSTGARLFLPPFMDPPVPTVHPLVWRGVGLCGAEMAFALQQAGKKGVVYDRSFTGWWIGACDDTSWLHNSIGLLSEAASVKLASPIYIDPGEVSSEYVEKGIKFPDPWPGGWWRLRDLVDYELTLSHALIKVSWLHKEDFLFNFYRMCKDGVESPTGHGPFAFVIPQQQSDARSLQKMLKVLMEGGVEIVRAKETKQTAQGQIQAGDYLVLMKQPYRPYAQALLEKQVYPDMRIYPGGPPQPPYDNAGWTLPLQMGVTCQRIDHPFKLDVEAVHGKELSHQSKPLTGTGGYLVYSSSNNGSYALAFRLLREKGVELFRSRKAITVNDKVFPAGSFWVSNDGTARKLANDMEEKWCLKPEIVDKKPEQDFEKVLSQRIGIYQSWRGNMDEGWTRLVFDEFGVPYTVLHPEDFSAQSATLDKYDVLVFASEPEEIILNNEPSPDSPYARWFTPNPPPYDKGIGKEGLAKLKTFVEKGGALVVLNEASELVMKHFKPPVDNVLRKMPDDKFFCPTSILMTIVDPNHPLGYGLPHTLPVVFSDSPAFQTRIPSGEWQRTVVARYPEKDVLLSGWLLGEENLARRAAVVELGYKKGIISMIGVRCQHRGQSHGSFKLLFNAVLHHH